MIWSITVKELTFWNGKLINVARNVSFTFDLKKLLENALRFVTDVVLSILLGRFHSRRRTHDAGSLTRTAFTYKLTGFGIDFFKKDFSVHYFVFVYS